MQEAPEVAHHLALAPGGQQVGVQPTVGRCGVALFDDNARLRQVRQGLPRMPYRDRERVVEQRVPNMVGRRADDEKRREDGLEVDGLSAPQHEERHCRDHHRICAGRLASFEILDGQRQLLRCFVPTDA